MQICHNYNFILLWKGYRLARLFELRQPYWMFRPNSLNWGYPSHSPFYTFRNIPLELANFTYKKPERPKRSGRYICYWRHINNGTSQAGSITNTPNMFLLYKPNVLTPHSNSSPKIVNIALHPSTLVRCLTLHGLLYCTLLIKFYGFRQCRDRQEYLFFIWFFCYNVFLDDRCNFKD